MLQHRKSLKNPYPTIWIIHTSGIYKRGPGGTLTLSDPTTLEDEFFCRKAKRYVRFNFSRKNQVMILSLKLKSRVVGGKEQSKYRVVTYYPQSHYETTS